MRHHIDTETLRCECGEPMCFFCGDCIAICPCDEVTTSDLQHGDDDEGCQ